MWSRIWAGLAAVAVLSVLALALPARVDRMWIDPVSGSVKSQTSWLLVPVRTRIDQSELERWIIAREGRHDVQWQFVYENDRSIFGRVLARGCGRAPEIHQFRAGALNTALVREVTDEELEEFVRVMRRGTRGEQAQAVEKAALILDRGYARARSARTGEGETAAGSGASSAR